MKKSMFSLLLLILLSLFVIPVNSQDCRLFFPDKVGDTREMKHYDAKNKLASITTQEVIDKKVSGKDVEVKVKASSFDADNKELYTSELNLLCEDGVFKLDMRNLIDPATMAAYKDMTIDVTSDNLAYPSGMKPGESLPDGNIKMVVKSEQLTLITITVSVTNRKVSAIEHLTTEAGKFSCYKLSYDVNSKFGFISRSSSAVEWIAEGVGLVKSESYNKKGKLEGSSVLSAIKR
jgi:hypothetical protein